jgi:thiamine biosynthesis protein ThiI
MQQYIQVHFFSEIALKGGNRRVFLQQARNNLNKAIRDISSGTLVHRSMTTLIPIHDGSLWPILSERLKNVIGVARFGKAWLAKPDLESVKELIPSLIKGNDAESFRITASRSDKSFPLNSPQINQELGSYIHELSNMRIDLKNPELDIKVRMDTREAVVSLEEIRGASGMPIGSGGKVAVMLSGGIDSPVAAFRMMLRGCKIIFIHFHSFPLVEGTSREKAKEIVNLLTRFQLNSRLMFVPFAEIQKQLIVTVPPAYRVILYRRFMLRIAESLAIRQKAGALVTGESLGQVSSQTLENLSTIGQVMKQLPIFRPLIGSDKQSIIREARNLGSYEISIIPDQDCCSLFVPKHPRTRSHPREIELIESQLDIDSMIAHAIENIETFDSSWPSN